MARKAIPSIFPEFLELKQFLCWFTVSLEKIPPTWAMGAGWDLLGIQALEPCTLKYEERIMWTSINQPMPDSHSVERYLASKKNPTCKVHGMMSSNIETRQYTSNFSRSTPWLRCIYALDIDCRRKKFDSTIISMFYSNWVLKLKT